MYVLLLLILIMCVMKIINDNILYYVMCIIINIINMCM